MKGYQKELEEQANSYLKGIEDFLKGDSTDILESNLFVPKMAEKIALERGERDT